MLEKKTNKLHDDDQQLHDDDQQLLDDDQQLHDDDQQLHDDDQQTTQRQTPNTLCWNQKNLPLNFYILL